MKKLNILIMIMILTLFVFANDSRAAPQILGGGDGSGDATTLHDISIVAPTAGDDGKYFQYEHDTPAQQYQWATPPGGGNMDTAVYDNDTDSLIDADAGGTELDTSGSTGVPSISTGTWSVNAQLPLSLGGTGTTLADPDADKAFYWDDTAGVTDFLGFEPDDFSIASDTLSLVAEIPHLDAAETIAANWVNTANPWAIDEGGTGSANASDARTALGLAIGTNVQAQDAELEALAGLTSAANKLPYFTGSGTADVTDLSAYMIGVIDDADEGTFKQTVNLEIGTDVQAQDATLQTIATASDVPGSIVDIANTTIETNIASNDLIIIYDVTATANRAMTRGNFIAGIGAGQAITFDIDDDGGDDTSDLGEIATTGDTNAVFYYAGADKMIIRVGNNWPTADLASTLTITDNEDTNENNAILFTSAGDLDGGDLGIESDGDFYYNPSTGTIHATILELGSGANVTETELEIIDGATLNTDDLNVIDGVADSGSLTSAELMILDGATLSVSDLNIIDGISDSGSLTAAELLYVDGVTSAIQTQLDARALESVVGTSLQANDLVNSGGVLSLVAEIPHLDESENISGTWEWQDNITQTFGDSAEWKLEYADGDEGTLSIYTAKTASTGTDNGMITIAVDTGNSGLTADQEVFEIGKGAQDDGDANFTELFSIDEDGDVWIAGTMTFAGGVDSFIQMTNNDGGLDGSGYRIWFETDVTDQLKYSINGSEKDVVNTSDANEITADWNLTGTVIIGDDDTAGTFKIGDGDAEYYTIATGNQTANFTLTLPDGGSINKYLYDTDGNGTLGWGTPSAAANTDGGTGAVQYNTGGALDSDASFVFTEVSYTLTIGESNGSSLDGKLVLFNEGGTDYTVTIQPGTQAGNATITLPGADGTLATLGNAETFGGLKTFSADITLSQESPDIIFIDSTTSGEAKIAISDGAGPDGVMDLQVDVGGTLYTFIQLDGVNENVNIAYPLVIGDGTATDFTLTFDASNADGVLTWDEDPGIFAFDHDIQMLDTASIATERDTADDYFSIEITDDVGDSPVQVEAIRVTNSGDADAGSVKVGGSTIKSIISLNATPDDMADDSYNGVVIEGRNCGEGLTQWNTVRIVDDSDPWHQANAAAAGEFPAQGLSVADCTDTNPAIILVTGIVRNEGWTGLTIGGAVYLGETAGALTQTAPSDSGDAIQIIGWALSDSEIYFDFSRPYLEVQ